MMYLKNTSLKDFDPEEMYPDGLPPESDFI